MDDRAFQVQRMLADELDCYKGKGNDYMNSNIKEIQELYMEEEKKEDKGTIGNKEVILVCPYEVSSTTSSSKTSFITDKVKNLTKYMKFVKTPSQTRIFRPPPYYQSLNKRGQKANKPEKSKKLYIQASAPSVGEILKLKENFPSLSTKKIENIHRMINDSRKSKPKINMITKGSLREQIIVSIGNNNKTKFIASSSTHITNINSTLKNIKSNVRADFVRMDQHSIIIMNKIAFTLDL